MIQLRSVIRWRTLRVVLLTLIIVSSVTVVSNALSSDEVTSDLDHTHRPAAIEDSTNLTVTTTHFGDDRKGAIAAFNDSGSLVYQNSSYTRYFDVDPVANTSTTVLYVAEQNLPSEECGIASSSELICVRQVIETVNLTTDTVTRLYSETVLTSQAPDSWHDVDRVGEDRYLVADIFKHRAFILNASSGLITWEWQATSDYRLDSGGGNKNDWTHINDVELIRNGSVVMVDLRNHDQVAFIHRERGLMENWTLGADDNRSTLYEQHNPDYISRAAGGPAVIVADSENNRIIEYQRSNGTWVQSWVWSDQEMEWPRDADRLPNGNTLIADTHSNRLLEVSPKGTVVWQVRYPQPYEVERLGTGDESTGGASAQEIGYTNQTVAGQTNGVQSDQSTSTRGTIVPTKVKHGLLWVAPAWMTFTDIILSLFAMGLTGLFVTVEFWRTDRVSIQLPVQIR